jgi:carbon-monoxide dehydrogenase small subunit
MDVIGININGLATTKGCPDRTHLADFLRDHHGLTGTHLGCEHGVCGACTVLVDGQPTRSCITFAPACNGRSVTAIEGYGDDILMCELRAAFTKHHALQCGFCTPGMLATARDIVQRFPYANEDLIRHELAGNICRCTGYVGIVAAILAVLKSRRTSLQESATAVTANTAVTASADAVCSGGNLAAFSIDPQSLPNKESSVEKADGEAFERAADKEGWSRVEASFDVPYPAADVWSFMLELHEVAACLPGAVLTEQSADRVAGYIAIKFGPMSARFNGTARLERDMQARRGVLKGAGKDTLSNSRASGNVTYIVRENNGGNASVVVDLQYALQGPLAQFSRSGLVKDFVRRMIADFGRNVARRMDPSLTEAQRKELVADSTNPIILFLSVMWNRIKSLFSRG